MPHLFSAQIIYLFSVIDIHITNFR